MSEDPVERWKSHSIRKLSEDEPWRYACTDCGSVSVEKMVRPINRINMANDRDDNSYTANGYGAASKLDMQRRRYRCAYCGHRMHKVVDKKTDGLATP